ncbi:hypothetical protein PLESTM_000139800 [Pleodorina starrii]|nr:hypothetical protein PLESTM_000139800 [Pleodorina starrii]
MSAIARAAQLLAEALREEVEQPQQPQQPQPQQQHLLDLLDLQNEIPPDAIRKPHEAAASSSGLAAVAAAIATAAAAAAVAAESGIVRQLQQLHTSLLEQVGEQHRAAAAELEAAAERRHRTQSLQAALAIVDRRLIANPNDVHYVRCAEVLMNALRGKETELPTHPLARLFVSSDEARARLARTLHGLTGIEPRVELVAQGTAPGGAAGEAAAVYVIRL